MTEPTSNNNSQPRDRSNLALYGQLALGMAIFGSGIPISKILTNAFPVFVASELSYVLLGEPFAGFIESVLLQSLGVYC